MRHLEALVLLTVIGCGTEETCDDWYCQDGTNTATSGTDSTTDGKTDGKTDGTKSTKPSAAFSVDGILDATTALGTFVLTGVDCESTLPAAEAVPLDDCDDCDFAHAITLGVLDAVAMPCEGDEVMENLVLSLGHADPNELWVYRDDTGWFLDETASSTVNGDSWEFSLK
ncbi:MAG: hypothetical protein GWP91_08495 [Rhodobacterales bacterium]|nr:hypothetical protein [Rhodobacterales bacterium]